MRFSIFIQLIFAFFAFSLQTSLAQTGEGIAVIERAFNEKKYDVADRLLTSRLSYLQSNKLVDSLPLYIAITGKITLEKATPAEAVKEVQKFQERIKLLHPKPATLQQVFLNSANFYESLNLNELAYTACREAYSIGLTMGGVSPVAFAKMDSDMGTYAYRMGDLSLSETHHRNAVKVFLSSKNPDYDDLYLAGNNMGSLMWFASKTDSALYYFTIALDAVSKMEPTPHNLYYRAAVLQNNMAAIYGIEGQVTKGIEAMKAAIQNIKTFLATKEPHPKKENALYFQFEAADNLAGFYKELGNYRQAHDLLLHSYEQKQKMLTKDNPDIFKSQVLLGQLYYEMKEPERAEQLLTTALNNFLKADGDYLFWQADAYNTLSSLYDEKGDRTQAAAYFEKADVFYERSLQGEYDNIYLEFLRKAALFYAENDMLEKGLARANKGKSYAAKTQGTESLLYFYQLLNLSEVHFVAGNYRESLAYSVDGLNTVNRIIASGSNQLDSITMELKKPKAILLKAWSEYEMLADKTVVGLNHILKQLNEALAILEKRKSVIQDPKDISLLLSQHTDLLDFTKQVILQLYHITGLEIYADQLISLHESGIYNRIRSRMDRSGITLFAHLPADVAAKESTLKNAVALALKGTGTHDQKMQAYIKAVNKWNDYLNEIKTSYPQYYKMRYASIFKSIQQLQSELSEHVTVIRYFFVGKDLLALVADKKQKHLYQLNSASLDSNILALSKSLMSEGEKTADLLHVLYRQLWAPIAKNVHNNKVIIIPDGILYNLNFEILTPQKITRFAELRTKSLLAQYAISYQYSFLLSGERQATQGLNKNFVAFAPGFSDEVKNKYKATQKDSAEVDQAYLTLLPQPFTIFLANKTQKLLDGSAYFNEQSTLNSFKNNAGNHKIIHIGTHAESDNLHPEFSRLIFAKDTKENSKDNSLYLFDIYNYDLTSNLTVLTACESGKPGYEDGEGMISLAHAFNYAGSESIITGLCKIDEQSSAILMDLFYKKLLEGLSKDEALQQAKLAYLESAEGRMLSPQYWAGLVLMGDTAPVSIKRSFHPIWIIIAVVVVLLAGGYIAKRRFSE